MDKKAPVDLEIDPETVHRKYREERDKRLRPDGAAQYIKAMGQFAHFSDNIFDKPLVRDPVDVEVGTVIIGGGFSGLFASANLQKAGVEDFCIIDQGADFGGTWYWNRYPGLACDVESYCYMPLLEDVGYVPTQKYATGAEIFEHCQRIGRHFDLYRRTYFQTKAIEATWDEKNALWVVKTDRNDTVRGRFLIRAGSGSGAPKLPGVPGIETFKGRQFHTFRWDYEYTGGGPKGNLDKLKDKRVGIIGTGATAIQAVPHLAASAKQLYVFQRTPSTINVRANRPTDPEWAQSLRPGWQKERMTNFEAVVSGIYQEEDMVADGWTEIFASVFFLSQKEKNKIPPEEVVQLADLKKMEANRRRIDEIVEDRATAEALKPWYNLFCKRPGFSDEYLNAFNRPNVKLVDTKGRGVERITESAVVVEGQSYEVDCIVYATGFGVEGSMEYRQGFDPKGRGGVTLGEFWSKGFKTLHGIHTDTFPNYFQTFGPQGPLSINFSFSLQTHSEIIAAIIADCVRNKVRTFEVTVEAEDRWQKALREKAISRAKFFEECTPSYYNGEGKGRISFFDLFYFGGPVEYREIVDDWLSNGGIERDVARTFLEEGATKHPTQP
ncbi:MAG TPA: NAD(P)/FAD-dependent oxidoreductase [Steroidobacteraceae bacterium]|jgi:cyclohexanone monooxygenase